MELIKTNRLQLVKCFRSLYSSFSSAGSNQTKEDIRKANLLARGLPKVKPIPGVKEIILVSSGKGGVGKINLAAVLKLIFPHKHIGLLDTDVFGPSVPLMMNLHDTPVLNKDNMMLPLTNHGIKCMSMGFLIPEDSSVVWRGLMVMQALNKLMWQVHWGTIDYLIVDTPPGTGDTHLSLIQNIPISGVILITTPQTASIQVTKRGASMFQKLNIPIIGIVENMSYVKCTSCLEKIKLFGTGTSKLSEDLGATILASFPLNDEINKSVDVGTPIVVLNKDSETTFQFQNLAEKIVKNLIM
ncbi:iron-sulfur protein NUBPL isoform X2 [Agrilus planipennis]|uniref:Iron-sulfur protein NUBPL isoform X2 n=1 Tax=Agrilus planipennis TaxID=224129 RepID=A0A1W4WHG9_AGRPL|nr:iron-sulfur protein NUBPL isoform X2 [Agrilus planipennis]